jgi:hypothetical protein
MDALLEDSQAGWLTVFDIVWAALKVRLGESMKRASTGGVALWIGRNALSLTIAWLLAFSFFQAARIVGSGSDFMIARIMACALGAAIAYKLRASLVAALLTWLAGFYGSWLIFTPLFGAVMYEGQVALYERPHEFGRLAVSIVAATVTWRVVRRFTRRLRVA